MAAVRASSSPESTLERHRRRPCRPRPGTRRRSPPGARPRWRHVDGGGAHGAGDEGEPAHGVESAGDRLGGEQAGGGEPAAERAERLLVVQRDRCPGQALVDDEPDRVGADVDDGEGAGRHRPRSMSGHQRGARSRAAGELLAARPASCKALPRPERLGLVMKYLCAEKRLLVGLEALVAAVRAAGSSCWPCP